MFLKLFGLLGQARKLKQLAVSFLELVDRADDDLDNDGKSELANIKEDAVHLEESAVVSVKALMLQAKALLMRVERLVEHVKTGK